MESDTLVIVSIIALLGWICWLYFRRRQVLSELKRMQLQLACSALDKFGSAGEFVAFLQSIRFYLGEKPDPADPKKVIFSYSEPKEFVLSTRTK